MIKHHDCTGIQNLNFKCTTCHCEFDGEERYLEHIKTHEVIPVMSQKKIQESPNKELKFKCKECEFVFNSNSKMNMHMKETHAQNKLGVECDLCEAEGNEAKNLSSHIHDENREDIATRDLSVICGECGLTFVNEEHCYTHMMDHNEKQLLCDFYGEISDELEGTRHNCNSPTLVWTKCDECEFKSSQVSQIVEHMRTIHKETHHCHFCSFKLQDKNGVIEHMMDKHPTLTLLNNVSNQMSSIGDSFSSFEVFKKELTDILNKIIDGQNEVKQELFVTRNTLATTNKKVVELESNGQKKSHQS